MPYKHLPLRYLLPVIALLAISHSSNLLADISDINGELDKCSKTHDYDLKQGSQLGANELGKTERAFLECVYTGIRETLIPKALIPDDYEYLISQHKQMTNAVEKGEMTRQQRKARVQELLGKIKSNEVAESERRIRDLSAKRDQFLRSRERMLKRNPRMF